MIERRQDSNSAIRRSFAHSTMAPGFALADFQRLTGRCVFRHAALAAFYLALTGCASQGVTIPREVRVQVPVPCVAPTDVPQRPELMSDGEMLALDSYRAIWALWGDRLERQGYEAKLEAVVQGCSRLPSP
jgi:hypothetical protein